jgi:hypothetical protein
MKKRGFRIHEFDARVPNLLPILLAWLGRRPLEPPLGVFADRKVWTEQPETVLHGG